MIPIRLALISLLLHALVAQSQDTSVVYLLPEAEANIVAGSRFASEKLDVDYGLQFKSLAEILSQQSAHTCLLYGPPGTAASARLGGLPADHTTIIWEGQTLESPTLGQADLSLFPAFLFDDVELERPAVGSAFPASTFGGALILKNSEATENSAGLYVERSSLQNDAIGLRLGGIKGKLNSSTRVFVQSMLNRFDYVDYYKFDHPKETQYHNDGRNVQVMQKLDWRMNAHNRMELSAWYIDRKMELPRLMGDYGQSFAEQDDDQFRASLLWNRQYSHSTLSFRLGHNYEFQHYTDRQAEDMTPFIDSRMTTHRSVGEATLKMFATDSTWVIFALRHTATTAFNSNFSNHEAQRQVMALSAQGVRYLRHLKVSVASRLETRAAGKVAVEPAGDLVVKYPWRGFILSASGHRKFRQPDLNELFWVPGGNPELKAESGWQTTAGLAWNFHKTGVTGTLNATYRRSWINNSIWWWPAADQPSVFEAGNVYYLENEELQLGANVSWKKWTANATYINLKSTFNWADAEPRVQSYAPAHSAFASLLFNEKHCWVRASARFVGERPTSSEVGVSAPLEALLLANAAMGFELRRGSVLLEPSVAVDNMFNARTEYVRSYAQPGRVVYARLTLQFSKLKS